MFDSVKFAPEFTKTCNSREDLIETLNSPQFNHTTGDIISTDGFELVPGESGVRAQGVVYPITRPGLESLCARVGIPNPFARKIPIDLLTSNIRRLGQEEDSPVRLVTRESDNALVAVTGANFTPVSTARLLEKIDSKFLNSDDPEKVRPAHVSTRGTRIFFESSVDMKAEPEIGDIVSIGRELFNSESGQGDLIGKIFLYRLQCLNGAVAPVKFGVVRRPANSKLSMEKVLENFSNGFQSLHVQAGKMIPAFKVMKETEILDIDFLNVASAINRTIFNPSFGDFMGLSTDDAELKSVAYDLLAVTNYPTIRKEVSERRKYIREHPFSEAPAPGKVEGITYYDIYNRVTALPHKFPLDFSRRLNIEKIGGKIIEHVLENFCNDN